MLRPNEGQESTPASRDGVETYMFMEKSFLLHIHEAGYFASLTRAWSQSLATPESELGAISRIVPVRALVPRQSCTSCLRKEKASLNT
jgi:hypothetical protein